MQGGELFEHAGGERFAYLPRLNTNAPSIDMMQELLARELEDWMRPA